MADPSRRSGSDAVEGEDKDKGLRYRNGKPPVGRLLHNPAAGINP
jgi:hypothetical protein